MKRILHIRGISGGGPYVLFALAMVKIMVKVFMYLPSNFLRRHTRGDGGYHRKNIFSCLPLMIYYQQLRSCYQHSLYHESWELWLLLLV